MTVIDFTPLTKNGTVSVISGQERGQALRAEFDLDNLDTNNDVVTIVVPKYVDAVTPSFVLGMFGPSIRKLGSVPNFLERYQFKAAPHIISQVQRSAEYGLASGSALDSL